jgi:hypothetical protein
MHELPANQSYILQGIERPIIECLRMYITLIQFVSLPCKYPQRLGLNATLGFDIISTIARLCFGFKPGSVSILC